MACVAYHMAMRGVGLIAMVADVTSKRGIRGLMSPMT